MKKIRAAAILAIVGGLIYGAMPVAFVGLLLGDESPATKVTLGGLLLFAVLCIAVGVKLLKPIATSKQRIAAWLMVASSLVPWIMLFIPDLLGLSIDSEALALIPAILIGFPSLLTGGILALVASRKGNSSRSES